MAAVVATRDVRSVHAAAGHEQHRDEANDQAQSREPAHDNLPRGEVSGL
jgi:hypothetical protein